MLRLLAPEFCVACGGAAGAVLCGGCRRDLKPIGDGRLGEFAYEGPAGALVRALKFRGQRSVASAMAAHLVLIRESPQGVVVPAPSHRDHVRRRGLDHGALLARSFAKRAGLAYLPCLERVGDSLPQVGRGRAERMSGPAGDIRVRRGARAPAVVVLIDDVVTTGATLAACANALTQAGTLTVTAIAYSRTAAR